MKKEDEDEFKYLWTTEKDDYCLLKGEGESGDCIMSTKQKSMVIIEEGTIVAEIMDNMLRAGVRVFDTMKEWDAFVESQPGYLTPLEWIEAHGKYPFSRSARPPKTDS